MRKFEVLNGEGHSLVVGSECQLVRYHDQTSVHVVGVDEHGEKALALIKFKDLKDKNPREIKVDAINIVEAIDDRGKYVCYLNSIKDLSVGDLIMANVSYYFTITNIYTFDELPKQSIDLEYLSKCALHTHNNFIERTGKRESCVKKLVRKKTRKKKASPAV